MIVVPLICPEHRCDVGRVLLGDHVVDRPLAADRPEAIAEPAGQRRRHVAAVAAAEHADAIAVAERVGGQGVVEHRHHVVDVDRPPAGAGHLVGLGATDRLSPCGVPAAAAAWVAHQHDEPGGGLHLGLVEERLAVLGERSAVDVDQHRVRRRLVEVLGAHDPGVDLVAAVGARHGELLPVRPRPRQRRHLAVERDQLGGALHGGLGHRHRPAGGVEALHRRAGPW